MFNRTNQISADKCCFTS